MDKRTILQNKYFLYATEFFAGMSVMAIELGASRLLAPYFSSSQIVWTVIIGAIMIAMALGNIWGGKMADKNPDPGKLYNRIIIAAIWIALIPFVGKYVIAGVSLLVALVVTNNFLVWASLVCCLVIFVFPLMLLGTVTPSLVKYAVHDLEKNGEIVGRLGALNTIGSIVGTFVPTFVTIPTVGTAATFLIFAGILAILSILYFASIGKFKLKAVVSIVLIIGLSFGCSSYTFAFWESDVVYEGESIYNYLQVKDTDESVILSTNVLAGVQSIKMKNKQLTGMYYDYAIAAPFMAGVPGKENGDILILGLGTGTFASMCTQYFPSAHVQGVEIDQKIADLAKEYFGLPEKVDVSVYDGRAYLSTDKKYDVIMVDAYQDITIPFQMSTVEFFTLVKAHLSENGVMVVNLNMASSKEGSINDYLSDTIASVFTDVYTVNVDNGTNTELFAFQTKGGLATFNKTYTDYCIKNNNKQLLSMMNNVSSGLQKADKGELILTDDKAPVELLGMKAIDEIIVDELSYYKDILKSGDMEKIKSLLN